MRRTTPALALLPCALALLAACALALPVFAAAANTISPPATLVSGNGFGFVVLRKRDGHLTKLYAHPYAYERADPADPLGEGIATTQFMDELWREGAHGVTAATARASARYLQQSQVMQFATREGKGTAFMPFGLERAALLLHWQGKPGTHGAWRVRWAHPVSEREAVSSEGATLLHFTGATESLLLVPLDGARAATPASPAGDADLARHDAWALLPLESGAEPRAALDALRRWQDGRAPRALVTHELAEFERWRVPLPAAVRDAVARTVWRQSETVLRMGQSREPNTATRHGRGLIVASLPGGAWFTPWVRDMAYATVALARMGHLAEARAALLAYFDAQPTGVMRAQTAGADYQVSVVRYWGDGAEQPFFTQEGSTNVELDNWGLVLWALGEYQQRAGDASLLADATHRGSVYESARDYIVRPLLANLEPPGDAQGDPQGDPQGDALVVRADTSIWEEREADRKHFAWTSAMAIVGLQAFAGIAQSHGDAAASANARQAVAQLQRGFTAAFVRDGKLRGTLEPGIKNDIDGALLPIIGLGVVGDRALVEDVVARMAALKVASGGYRRVQSTYTDPRIFEYWYERQEFVFVDLALSDVMRELGRKREAAALLRKVLGNAAAHDGLVPEMLVSVPCELFPGHIGDPTGANPMSGYGAGAVVLSLLRPVP